MINKIVSIGLLATSLVGGSINYKNQEFTYEYSVVLNSNTMGDVLDGYTYKEYLIDEYNQIINYLDPSLHQDAVINNINKFAKSGSVAKYEDGKIVVYVGEAKGNALKGELRKDACDVSTVRVKFFFSKFFFNK